MERRLSLRVAGVRRRARIEQQRHHLRVALSARVHQRRKPVGVGPVHRVGVSVSALQGSSQRLSLSLLRLLHELPNQLISAGLGLLRLAPWSGAEQSEARLEQQEEEKEKEEGNNAKSL